MPEVTKWFNGLSAIFRNSLIAAVVAIVFTAVLNYGHKWLIIKENSELKTEIRDKTLQIERLKALNMKLEIKLIKCKAEYNNLRANTDNMPLVYWERDIETGLISYINPEFERQVLEPLNFDRYDLLYKPDRNVFGSDANNYITSFNYVVKTGKPITKTEISHDTIGNIINWRSTKFPIYEDGIMTKVGGVSYIIE